MPEDPASMIAALIDGKGRKPYGLTEVNQRAHALQAAMLAEAARCSASVITAALLHDIGHMVHDLGEDPAAKGIDDRHEELGHAFLTQWFGPDVTEPVRLHVAAKRYLCATEPGYFSRLSRDSVISLKLQGGPMRSEEVAAFEALPRWRDAVALRRFDEAAKVKDLETRDLGHFLPHIRACLRT